MLYDDLQKILQEIKAQIFRIAESEGKELAEDDPVWIYVARVCDQAALGKSAPAIAEHYAQGFDVTEEDVKQIEATLYTHEHRVEQFRKTYEDGMTLALAELKHPQKAWDRINAVREAVFSQL